MLTVFRGDGAGARVVGAAIFLVVAALVASCGKTAQAGGANDAAVAEKAAAPGEAGAFAANPRLRACFLDRAHPELPRFALGRLPSGRALPDENGQLDSRYYGAFRDNQMGGPDSDLRDALADDYTSGALKLLPPRAGEPLVLAIAAPFGSMRTAWNPPLEPVELQGHTIIVRVEDPGASADFTAGKNISRQEVYLLALPALDAGAYTLEARIHVASGKEKVPSQLRRVAVSFNVAEKGAADGAGATAVTMSDGNGGGAATAASVPSTLPMPAVLADWSYQPVWYATARKYNLMKEGPGGKFGLSAGRCSGAGGATNPFDFFRNPKPQEMLPSADLPPLVPATSDETLYGMVFLRAVDSGEWASLRCVRWQGEHGVIEVDEWRDSGERAANVAGHPMLLVDLRPPIESKGTTPSGHYVLDLVVHRLVAPQPGGWYAEQAGSGLAAGDVDHLAFDVK